MLCSWWVSCSSIGISLASRPRCYHFCETVFSDCGIGRNNAINCNCECCYIWYSLFDGTRLQSTWQMRFINYHQGVCSSSCSYWCSTFGRWPEDNLLNELLWCCLDNVYEGGAESSQACCNYNSCTKYQYHIIISG